MHIQFKIKGRLTFIIHVATSKRNQLLSADFTRNGTKITFDYSILYFLDESTEILELTYS